MSFVGRCGWVLVAIEQVSQEIDSCTLLFAQLECGRRMFSTHRSDIMLMTFDAAALALVEKDACAYTPNRYQHQLSYISEYCSIDSRNDHAVSPLANRSLLNTLQTQAKSHGPQVRPSINQHIDPSTLISIIVKAPSVSSHIPNGLLNNPPTPK